MPVQKPDDLSLSDEELLLQARRQRREFPNAPLFILIKRHERAVYSQIMHVLRDEPDQSIAAESVFQEGWAQFIHGDYPVDGVHTRVRGTVLRIAELLAFRLLCRKIQPVFPRPEDSPRGARLPGGPPRAALPGRPTL